MVPQTGTMHIVDRKTLTRVKYVIHSVTPTEATDVYNITYTTSEASFGTKSYSYGSQEEFRNQIGFNYLVDLRIADNSEIGEYGHFHQAVISNKVDSLCNTLKFINRAKRTYESYMFVWEGVLYRWPNTSMDGVLLSRLRKITGQNLLVEKI